VSGWLALVGGAEWSDDCRGFDAQLLEASGGTEVLVLPTAAAYEHPDRAVAHAAEYFEALGGRATGLDVLRRPDAEQADNAHAVRSARFVYLAGGSPLHLRSVLKDSAVWRALTEAWEDGAVVAGSSAGAMVLGEPMVDPRGGAFTLGLGLVTSLAVIAHANSWSAETRHRTAQLAPKGVPMVAIDEATAALRAPDGTWTTAGAGAVAVSCDGVECPLSQLP